MSTTLINWRIYQLANRLKIDLHLFVNSKQQINYENTKRPLVINVILVFIELLRNSACYDPADRSRLSGHAQLHFYEAIAIGPCTITSPAHFNWNRFCSKIFPRSMYNLDSAGGISTKAPFLMQLCSTK